MKKNLGAPCLVRRGGRHGISSGTNTLLWSGIDVDIPTEPAHSKCSPDGVRDAVLAAFHGNADGIILSRKYSEMKLTDLTGAQQALHQLHLPT